MPRYGLYQKDSTGAYHFSGGFGKEPIATAAATRRLNHFGHPLEFRIERDGKPWLAGRSIVPRSGNIRIEWRDE